MEHKLSTIVASDSRATKKTRDSIIKWFPDRELVVMPNPISPDAEDVIDLSSFEPENLDKDFVDGCSYLRVKLFHDTPVKQIWSRKITGATFVFMLNEYINAINDKGSTIQFSDIWEFYLESELQQKYEDSLVYVEKTIRNHMWGIEEDEPTPDDGSDAGLNFAKLPLCRQDVMVIFDDLRTEVIGRFDELLKMANTIDERNTISRKME